MQNHEHKRKTKGEKNWKTKILWAKQTAFLAPWPSTRGQLQPHGCMQELFEKYKKNELNTRFQQKFATGSYGVGIWHAWCSWNAWEICSSLVQKKKKRKKKISSHNFPKKQLTSFWFQGILGVNPKIPWDQKLVDCCLGSLCEEKYIFFSFFFWTSELHISQAFYEHQVHPIPTPYEPVANFC
jgi:hypothetical protein